MGKRSRRRHDRQTQDVPEEYRKLESPELRCKMYLKVLNDIRDGIISGTLSSLSKACNDLIGIHHLENVEVLLTLEEHPKNPFVGTNLVIFTCKHEQAEALKYFLSPCEQTLFKLYEKMGLWMIHPRRLDSFTHTAFYYAIRANNVELVETLIGQWPETLVRAWPEHYMVLEEQLSKSYAEVMMKNFLISEEVEMAVEGKLLEMRFFVGGEKAPKLIPSVQDVMDRMKLLISAIDDVVSEQPSELVCDEFTFLHNIRFITQNVHVVKRVVKPTYITIPWEEMEFVLVVFLLSKQGNEFLNVLYAAIISKATLIDHLRNFAKCLKSQQDLFGLNKGDCSYPNVTRKRARDHILARCPFLKQLYLDFDVSRDLHSLDLIRKYINLSRAADPNQKSGRLAIIRSLQMVGELMKNTLLSPKLSEITSAWLLSHLTKNTRKVIVQLRDSLSHAASLSKRLEIEAETTSDVFSIIQEDLAKIEPAVVNHLLQKLLMVTACQLEVLMESDEDAQISEIIDNFSRLKTKTLISACNCLDQHFQGLSKKIDVLYSRVPNPTLADKQIVSTMKKAAAEKENAHHRLILQFSTLGGLAGHPWNLEIQAVKSIAKLLLEQIAYHLVGSEDIGTLAKHLFTTVAPRLSKDDFAPLWEAVRAVLDSSTCSSSSNTEAIEEFQLELEQPDKVGLTTCRNFNLLLLHKIDELEIALASKHESVNSDDSSPKSWKNYCFKRSSDLKQSDEGTSKTWLLHLEMLLMDVMAILDSSRRRLANNLGAIESDTPTIDGKHLRDHLAHGNDVVSVLLRNPTTSLILNAAVLVSKKDYLANAFQIGRVVWNREDEAVKQYVAASATAMNQQQLFNSLLEGDLDSVVFYIENGADIYARTSCRMTSLHYAAMSPRVGPLNYLLKQWQGSIDVQNLNKQNPLHLAAIHGRFENVQALLREGTIPIDSQDATGRTPLHLAAKTGHSGVIRILLANKANQNTLDKGRQLPLHFALANNHVQAAKTLMKLHNLKDSLVRKLSLLHIAAEGGALDIVQYLLNEGVEVDAKCDGNCTPLHLAAAKGHLEVVKALVARGADTNANCTTGTPLHLACETNQTALVRYLLRQNVDVDSCGNKIFPPIFHAALNGNADIVKLLLNRNADIHIVWIGNNRTLLHAAFVNSPNVEVVKLLLIKSKHWVNMQDTCGLTPLHYCARLGNEDLLAALVASGAALEVKDSGGRTPLFYAIQAGRTAAVKYLIDVGAEVNILDKSCYTPLRLGCQYGEEKIVELLIKSGADIGDTGGIFGPLQGAIIHGNEKIVQLLVANGASVNGSTQFSSTPLHYAANLGHTRILEVLCKAGADINQMAADGSTPLRSACLGGQYGTAAALIERGCTIEMNIVDSNHPLLLAIKSNEPDIIKLLLSKGVKVKQPHLELAVCYGSIEVMEILLKFSPPGIISQDLLFAACSKSRKGIVKVLLKGGLNPNATTDGSYTCLHLAACTGDDALMRLLLNYRADINSRCANGSTPLHLTATVGHVKTTSLLLASGADIAATDIQGCTPLEAAVASKNNDVVKLMFEHNTDNDCRYNSSRLLLVAAEHGNLEVVKYLVSKGADVNCTNSAGSKAIHIAAQEGFCDIVDFFLTKMDINDPGTGGNTLLHYASRGSGDCISIAKLLIEDSKMSINQTNDQGLTPLHIAASLSKNLALVTFLLQNGAFYNVTSCDGTKPIDIATPEIFPTLSATHYLFNAVKAGNLVEVKRGIKEGAIVDAKNHQNDSPLLWAAWNGNESVVEMLLAHKANPNITGKDSNTPLHYACKKSASKVVLSLLINGANFEPCNTSRKTPLDLTSADKLSSFLTLIRDSFTKVKSKNISVSKKLLRAKLTSEELRAVFNCRDAWGKTLLASSILAGFPDVKILRTLFVEDRTTFLAGTDLLNCERFDDALNLALPKLKQRQRMFTRESLMYADIQDIVGKALYKLQIYPRALDTFQDLHDAYRDMLGECHKETLVVRGTIALVLHREDKHDEALQHFEWILDRAKTLFPPQDPELLQIKAHMAGVLGVAGKPEEAIKMNKELLTIYQKKHGYSHPITLCLQKNLASMLSATGKYKESLALYKHVLEKREKVLGPSHSDTMRTRSEIAYVHYLMGKHTEALELFGDSLNYQTSTLPSGNRDVLMSKVQEVTALLANFEFARAWQIYKELTEHKHTAIPEVKKSIERLGKIFATGSQALGTAWCGDDSNESEELSYGPAASDMMLSGEGMLPPQVVALMQRLGLSST